MGHKLVVRVLHRQESSELGPLCFDCRCYLQLRMGKNNLLSFRQAIWQLRQIAVSIL